MHTTYIFPVKGKKKVANNIKKQLNVKKNELKINNKKNFLCTH